MNETKEIEVPARPRWYHTGYQLAKDASYRIEVPLGQTWFDWGNPFSPTGGTLPTQRLFRPLLRCKGDGEHRAEFFTLIGTIGKSLKHAFVIGGGPREFTAPTKGELVCFANDVWFAYWNNSGSVRFAITQLSSSAIGSTGTSASLPSS